jgi:hypothetical protein
MRRTEKETPTPVDRETLKSFVSNDKDVCFCYAPPLDATGFENGYLIAEELVCSAVSEERVCNSCETYTSHIVSPGWGGSM